MPVLDGFKLLEAVKTHEHLKTLPFVVLSSSNHDQDRERARVLGADLYLVKPTRLEEMSEIARAVDSLITNIFGGDTATRLRVIVQSLDSDKFFCGGTHWTDKSNCALDFERVQRALSFCVQSKLIAVRILLDTRVPVGSVPHVIHPLRAGRKVIPPLISGPPNFSSSFSPVFLVHATGVSNLTEFL